MNGASISSCLVAQRLPICRFGRITRDSENGVSRVRHISTHVQIADDPTGDALHFPRRRLGLLNQSLRVRSEPTKSERPG